MNSPASPQTEVSSPTCPIGPRVLVIDDEEPVARFVARALTSKLGCVVECASNGHDARAAVERTDFALVLCDIRMPSMTGVEFLTWLTDHRPELLEKTVFMTGDGRSSAVSAEIERAGIPVLRKPFTIDVLLGVATEILIARADQPNTLGNCRRYEYLRNRHKLVTDRGHTLYSEIVGSRVQQAPWQTRIACKKRLVSRGCTRSVADRREPLGTTVSLFPAASTAGTRSRTVGARQSPRHHSACRSCRIRQSANRSAPVPYHRPRATKYSARVRL